MQPPPGPVDDLPVKATVAFAYRCVFHDLGNFATVAFLPLVISVGLALPLSLMGDSPFSFLLRLIAAAVPYTLFGVAWYRLILLGAQAAPPRPIPKWEARHWRFLRFALLLLLAGQGATFLAATQMIGEIPVPGEVVEPNPGLVLGWLAILIVVFVVLLRFSLVFPAIAVDETYDMVHAWRHSKRQGLRLLGATFLASIPFFVLFWIILLVFVPGPAIVAAEQSAAGPGFGTLLVLHILQNLVSYLVLGVTMAVIAGAFRICGGWIPDTGGPPAPIGET